MATEAPWALVRRRLALLRLQGLAQLLIAVTLKHDELDCTYSTQSHTCTVQSAAEAIFAAVT